MAFLTISHNNVNNLILSFQTIGAQLMWWLLVWVGNREIVPPLGILFPRVIPCHLQALIDLVKLISFLKQLFVYLEGGVMLSKLVFLMEKGFWNLLEKDGWTVYGLHNPKTFLFQVVKLVNHKSRWWAADWRETGVYSLRCGKHVSCFTNNPLLDFICWRTSSNSVLPILKCDSLKLQHVQVEGINNNNLLYRKIKQQYFLMLDQGG